MTKEAGYRLALAAMVGALLGTGGATALQPDRPAPSVPVAQYAEPCANSAALDARLTALERKLGELSADVRVLLDRDARESREARARREGAGA